MVTPKRLMLDLGAHKGNDTAFYLDKGWKVVAVEAHYELAKECASRFHLQIGDCRVVNRAISPEGKPTKLYTSSKGVHGETHSTQPHRTKRPEGVPMHVEGTTIGYLLKTHGVPDYMKVDIEGADVLAIRQLHEWSTKSQGIKHAGGWTKFTIGSPVPALLSVELCQEHPEEALEIFSHLAYMGYDRFGLERQHWDVTVDVDTLRYPMTISQAATRWFEPWGCKSADIWYDLHAKHKDAT